MGRGFALPAALAGLAVASLGGCGADTGTGSASSGSGVATEAFHLRMSGRSQAARDLLEAALDSSGADSTVYYELARTQFYLLDLEAAQRSIDAAAALQPWQARNHAFRALTATYRAVDLAHHQGDAAAAETQMEIAVGALEEAVRLESSDHDSRLFLVELYASADTSESRAQAAEHAQRLVLGSPAHWYAARARLEPDHAVAVWEEAVAALGDDPRTHEGLARAHLQQGDVDAAAAEVEVALQHRGCDGLILLDLARYYAMAEGDYGAADRAVMRYLKTDPVVPLRAYALFLRGRLQMDQGHTERADELLAEAQALDPHVWQTFMPPPPLLFEER
jgi:tetratricopeptide (TPR) repeat protein